MQWQAQVIRCANVLVFYYFEMQIQGILRNLVHCRVATSVQARGMNSIISCRSALDEKQVGDAFTSYKRHRHIAASA